MLGSTAPVSCSRLHGTRFPYPPLTPAPAQWTMRSRRGGRVARPPASPRHRSPCLHSTTSPRYPRHPAQGSRPRGRRPLRCPPSRDLAPPSAPVDPRLGGAEHGSAGAGTGPRRGRKSRAESPSRSLRSKHTPGSPPREDRRRQAQGPGERRLSSPRACRTEPLRRTVATDSVSS
jgi:hypothetical protein